MEKEQTDSKLSVNARRKKYSLGSAKLINYNRDPNRRIDFLDDDYMTPISPDESQTTDLYGNTIRRDLRDPGKMSEIERNEYLTQLMQSKLFWNMPVAKGNLNISDAVLPAVRYETDKVADLKQPRVQLQTSQDIANAIAMGDRYYKAMGDWYNTIKNDPELYKLYAGDDDALRRDAKLVASRHNEAGGDARKMFQNGYEDIRHYNPQRVGLSEVGLSVNRALIGSRAPAYYNEEYSVSGLSDDDLQRYYYATRQRMLNAYDEANRLRQKYYTEDPSRPSSDYVPFSSVNNVNDYIAVQTARQGLMPRSTNNRARGGSMPTQQKKPSPEWICNNLHFIKLIHKTYKIAANS